MKITVFGARGAIGRLVVRLALVRGWEVTGFARNTDGLEPAPGLTLVRAELSDERAIESALRGSQAALTAFGPSFGRPKGNDLPLKNGVRLIARKMSELGVRRLVVLATPSVRSNEDEPVLKARLLPAAIRLLLPYAYREITGMGRETAISGLDWTLVRQIRPVNGPARGVVAGFMNRKTKFIVTREDVARFMVDQVEDQKYIHRLPVIFSKR